MSHCWNDDERDTRGFVTSRSSQVEVREPYVSICDVLKEMHNDQKEKQYEKIRIQPRKPRAFARPPPPPVVQGIEVNYQDEEEDNEDQESNESIMENEMYKKSWYS